MKDLKIGDKVYYIAIWEQEIEEWTIIDIKEDSIIIIKNEEEQKIFNFLFENWWGITPQQAVERAMLNYLKLISSDVRKFLLIEKMFNKINQINNEKL